jgi:hypothetical protein
MDVISEMPAAWRLTVRRWMRINRSRIRVVDGRPAPSRSDEYLLYQTLVGTFPPGEQDPSALNAYRERIERYSIKAAREAKESTSWFAVNEAYEEALTGFVAALLHGSADNLFLAELQAQSPTFAWFGMLNSISMTLLKLTSPGVPDIYQGTELLDWSLVDPDNRRAVDYGLRSKHLGSLAAHDRAGGESWAAFVRALFAAPYDGRAKLWVILRALEVRRTHPALFAYGDYRPIAVAGAHADHVIAFARTNGDGGVVVVAGRLFASLGLASEALPLGDIWSDTELDLGFLQPGTVLFNVLTNETFVVERARSRLEGLFATFPGALLRYSTQLQTTAIDTPWVQRVPGDHPVSRFTPPGTRRGRRRVYRVARRARVPCLWTSVPFRARAIIPQFNTDTIATTLATAGIGYVHMPSLGGCAATARLGQRRLAQCSRSRVRGLIQTPAFAAAIDELIDIARAQPTAIMCAEASRGAAIAR